MRFVRVALLGDVPDDVLDEAVRQAQGRCVRADGTRPAPRPGLTDREAVSGLVLAATIRPGDMRGRGAIPGFDGTADGVADLEGQRGPDEVSRFGPVGPLSGGYSLVAWTAGQPGAPAPGVWRWDEHLALDADGCPDVGDCAGVRRLDLADVLQGTRPRPPGQSARAAAELAGAHRGCLLAAVPRIGGGWSVAGPGARVSRVRTVWRRTGTVVRSPGAGSQLLPEEEHVLFPSCLHGWLVAGHGLHELESATVVLRC